MLQKLKVLGPGLLYAGAAIGVSHIVQSTRAGAEYGLILLLAILIAHIVKYPFFEIGPRYAASTGKSLVHGYGKIGKWALWLVITITFLTMFIIQAGVTVVTAGIANKIFHLSFAPWQTALGLLAICLSILLIGRYSLLENAMKVIMIVLAVTTLGAVASSFFTEPITQSSWERSFSIFDEIDVIFLIAFVGWMPAPLDISIWHSLWTTADQKSGDRWGLKSALFDFKIGYWGTMVLAICFLLLGANVLYGTGKELSPLGSVFAGNLIDVYTLSLGAWAYYIIAIAAFTTMFSTTLTCLDAMPRTMAALISEIKNHGKHSGSTATELASSESRQYYIYNIFTLILGTILVLSLLIKNMGQMIQLATIISFLTAPVIAWLNLKTEKSLPVEHQMSRLAKNMANIGLLFLIIFSLYYLKILMNI
jgi:Mn2+/Fe2+ NRAMP family transporter